MPSRAPTRSSSGRAASTPACCRPCSSRASARRWPQVQGPVVLVANLLTEGRGMADFTAADAVRHIGDQHRAARGRGALQRRAAAGRACSSATRPSTSIRCHSATCPRTSRWWRRRSGTDRSPATSVGASRMRCGACWRDGCCSGFAMAVARLRHTRQRSTPDAEMPNPEPESEGPRPKAAATPWRRCSGRVPLHDASLADRLIDHVRAGGGAVSEAGILHR